MTPSIWRGIGCDTKVPSKNRNVKTVIRDDSWPVDYLITTAFVQYQHLVLLGAKLNSSYIHKIFTISLAI